jgi:release factor glutamine methyltransferase
MINSAADLLELAQPRPLAAFPDVLQPSDHTAALIQMLHRSRARVAGASVLEIGSGSGVVLAAAADLGARALCGVDVEDVAIHSSARMLDSLGYGAIAELTRGDMWVPLAGRRFDLIVANLPHFPSDAVLPGRLPTWSAGGADGRRLLDRFLGGLPDHLAPGGAAMITHNGFVDLERSRALVEPHGFSIGILMTTLLFLPAERLRRMSAALLARERGRSIHCYGPHAFADLHIVAITRPDTGARRASDA